MSHPVTPAPSPSARTLTFLHAPALSSMSTQKYQEETGMVSQWGWGLLKVS